MDLAAEARDDVVEVQDFFRTKNLNGLGLAGDVDRPRSRINTRTPGTPLREILIDLFAQVRRTAFGLGRGNPFLADEREVRRPHGIGIAGERQPTSLTTTPMPRPSRRRPGERRGASPPCRAEVLMLQQFGGVKSVCGPLGRGCCAAVGAVNIIA